MEYIIVMPDEHIVLCRSDVVASSHTGTFNLAGARGVLGEKFCLHTFSDWHCEPNQGIVSASQCYHHYHVG